VGVKVGVANYLMGVRVGVANFFLHQSIGIDENITFLFLSSIKTVGVSVWAV